VTSDFIFRKMSPIRATGLFVYLATGPAGVAGSPFGKWLQKHVKRLY
jgi:hypothetical protein